MWMESAADTTCSLPGPAVMIAGYMAAGGYFAETHEADRNRAEAHGAYGPAPGGKRNRK